MIPKGVQSSSGVSGNDELASSARTGAKKVRFGDFNAGSYESKTEKAVKLGILIGGGLLAWKLAQKIL